MCVLCTRGVLLSVVHTHTVHTHTHIHVFKLPGYCTGPEIKIIKIFFKKKISSHLHVPGTRVRVYIHVCN